jgi:hypothetical protein
MRPPKYKIGAFEGGFMKNLDGLIERQMHAEGAARPR